MKTLSYDECPVRSSNLVVERAGDDHIVRRDAHEDFVLNPTAFALWELCDGQTTVSEMVDAVCDLFDVTRAQARHDVVGSVRHMKEVGILA